MSVKSFSDFMGEVQDTILSYLPKEYEGADIDVQERTKVNRNQTGLTIIPANHSGETTPTLNMEAFYESYKNGESMDQILSRMADTITRAFDEIKDTPIAENPMGLMDKHKVYMQLINKESNRELLATVPHRDFNDMAIIYRVLVDKNEDGIQSVVVNDDLAEHMDVTEEELFELGAEQTKELFPVKIDSLANVMRGFFMDMDDISDDLISDMGMDEDMGLYMVTNDMCVNGATYMVYDDVLYEVAGKLHDDLYILPSSIHEFLAVPSSMGSPEELAAMVKDINSGVVREEDRLSNQVFFYDKDKRELTMVSNTPILGIKDADFSMAVAEPVMPNYDAPSENRAR